MLMDALRCYVDTISTFTIQFLRHHCYKKIIVLPILGREKIVPIKLEEKLYFFWKNSGTLDHQVKERQYN